MRFVTLLIATTIAFPSLAQEDSVQMVESLVKAYGHACGKALHTIPHDNSNQIFDLVCATNADGSGAENVYVVDLSGGAISITAK